MKVFNLLIIFIFTLVLNSCSNSVDEGKNLIDKAEFKIVSGDGQFAPVNTTFGLPLVVQLTSGGADFSSVPIYFEVVSGSTPATFINNIATTSSNGTASTLIKSGISDGTVTVKATVPMAQDTEKSVYFNLFVQGAADHWEVVNSGGATEGAGVPFTINVTARQIDNSVDTATTGPRYLSFSTDAPSAPDGTPVSLPADGFYNFTNGIIDTPPSVTLFNSSESGADLFTVTVTGSSITGTTTGIDVTDSADTTVKIIDFSDCSGDVVTTRFITAINDFDMYGFYFDAYGNCTTAASGNWTKTFTDPEAPFTVANNGVTTTTINPTAPGYSGTVTFNEGTWNYTTGTLTTTDATPDHFRVLGLDTIADYTADAGVSKQVLVQAEDAGNNITANYDGVHALTWTTTATATSPPSQTGLANFSASIPANTNYTFTLGQMVSPVVNATFYNSAETPTLSVNDGSGCAGMCGTSNAITISPDITNKAVIRSAPTNGGVQFDATLLTTDADDSYALYCATYDQYGNYLTDDTTSDWGINGTITVGEVAPDLVDESTVTYNPSTTGAVGSIYCDVDGTVDGLGMADSTDNFTVAPGAPDTFQIDGGGGNAAAFAVTAGTIFSATVNAYDADGNFCSNYDNATFSATVSYQTNSTAVNPAIPAEIPLTYSSPKIDNTDTTSKSYNLNFSSGSATISNLLLINDTESADEPTLRVVDNGAIVTTGNSGAITVNQNVLNSFALRDAASGGGNWINAPTITTDDTLNMYAAGYDIVGNYLSDINVDWTTTAPSGNCVAGELSGNPAPLTGTVGAIFSPTTVGNCVVSAYHAGLNQTDTTGSVTLTNGVVASFNVAISGNPTDVTAGSTFSVIVTALDSEGNTVLNYSPDTTYTLTTTAPNSPEGQAPTGFSLVTGDFTSGVATVTSVAVYDAGTNFTITATETGSGSITGTSTSYGVNPNTLHHYKTTSAVGPFVADGSSTFSVNIEAHDQWGNLTTTGIGALINLTAERVSDEALVDSIANGSNLDLSGASSATFSGLTYRVSHEIDLIATDSGAVTTPAADQARITFTPDIASLVNYEIDNFSTTTPTAGVAFTSNIYAKDIAGNTITGLDATLSARTMTTASGSNDSIYSDSPIEPATTFAFTNGVSANVSFTFYTAETIARTTITVDDGNTITGNAGAGNIVVGGNSLHHYANIETTTNFDADGIDTFQAQLVARDQYGNTVAGDASIGLAVNQLDANNPGLLGGTVSAINMTSGTATISNLTYNVFGSLELVTTGGSVSMDGARSLDYTADIVIGTLNHYAMTFTGPVTAGSALSVNVLAEDYGNNTIPTLEPILNARNFQWTSGLNDSPEGDLTTPNESTNFSLTFVAGVAPTTITFVKAETLAIGDLDITDDAGTPIIGTSAAALTINPDTADHIVFSGATTGTANDSTTYFLQIQSRDQFGNPNATGNAADSSLTLDITRISGATNVGPIGGTITGVNLRDNATVTRNDLTYQVGHVTKWAFDSGTVPSISIDEALSPQVTWTTTTETVASYTLEPDVTTITAGANLGVTLTAFDGGGNTLDYADTTLETLTYTFTTSSDCDAPHANFLASGGDPANATQDFTSGVVSLTYNIYNIAAACGSVGDFAVQDNNSTPVATSNTVAVTTINAAASEHFDVTENGFSANADGTAQTGTDVTVELHDLYGNPRTDAISGNLLSFQKVTGYGTNLGTLEACAPGADGCAGAKQAISAISVDFSGSATQTIYDLNYDVAHTVEVIATSGGITTTSARSANLKFDSVPGTIASYTLARPAATAVAGSNMTWTVTAYDTASNPMTGAENETMLEVLAYTLSDMSGGNMDGPEAGTYSGPSAAALDFNNTNAEATFTVNAYNTTNDIQIGDLRFSDGTTAITVDNDASNVVDITYAAAHHFHVTAAGFGGAEVSDDTTYGGTSLQIDLQDQYGNASQGATANNVDLIPRYVSGFGTNVGVLKATTTDTTATSDVTGINLDFTSTSTHTIHDISYNVFQEIELRASQGAIDTAIADTDNFDFDFDSSNVASYGLARVAATGTAGTATSWRITAYDQANNVMTGGTNKAELDSRTFTFTDQSGGDMNGPESGTAGVPASSTLAWTSGTGTVDFNVTAYHAVNGIAIGDIEIQDDYTTPISQTNADAMTITPESGNHFHVTNSGFPVDADAVQKAATSVTIELQDTYGNPTSDATVTNAAVALNQTAGFPATGLFNVSVADGDATPVDITGLSLDFSGTSSITYHDIAYDVGHTMELLVSHANTPGDTAGADSADIAFNVSAGTVQSYTLTFDNTNATAGVDAPATFTALDGGGNVLTGNDVTLNAITYNFTVPGGAGLDAPNASQTVANNDTADGSTLTFTNGVAPINWKFFRTGTVTTNFVRVIDNANTINTQNSDTLTIDPAAAVDYFIVNPLESITGTPTTVTVNARDTYGNTDTNFNTDVQLDADGSATGDGTVTITSGTGSLAIDDAVAETVNLSLTDINTTGLTLLTADVIFTGPPNQIAFLTQPNANETINKNFATMPQIEVRDSFGTRVWADSTTTVALNAFTDAGCSSAGAGVVAANSLTVTAGRVTYAGIQYSAAETIHLEASSGGLTTDCSNATTVYPSLVIDNPPGGNLQSDEAYTFEISGGVPPLSIAGSTYNSGGTDGGLYSGGGCPAGKFCVDVTPGTTTAVSDTLDVDDSASVTNNDSSTYAVDGAILTNTGDAVAYGSTPLDISNTFTIDNGGNIASGNLTVTFTPADASYWNYTAPTDFCNGNDLPAGNNCDITVDFLGATGNGGNPVNGAQTATLTITGATNGSLTLNLTANRDGPILTNTGSSGAYGLTASDDQLTYTFDNTGNATTGVLTTTFTPGDANYWNVDTDGCNTGTLIATQTCNIDITFRGDTANGGNPVNGAQSATLTVSGASGGSETVTLTATRDGAILTNVGASGNYGSTSTDDPQTITIENTGNGTTGVMTSIFTPIDPSYWSVTTNNCNTTLATNGTQCDVIIVFLGATGNASSPVPGTYTATLQVTGGTAGSRTINLTGTIP